MTADGGCGWKMWKEKTADSQKSKKNKTRNSDDKINKETKKKKERKLSIKPGLSSRSRMVGPLKVQYALSIVGTAYSSFFSTL